MEERVQMLGREIKLQLSERARRALAQRNSPLLAEMELYFSCLIRKTVRFREAPGEEGVLVSEKLKLRFRPVMTKHCGTDYTGDEPPVTDFPITRPERYVPRWLHLDYRGGQWRGDFGYLLVD